MSNPLYGEIYRNHGTSWIFGRRSVGRVIGDAAVGGGSQSKPFRSSGGARSGGSLSKADIARLDSMTRGAPQVMVKVVSRTHTASQLKRHVDYISRDGALELESEYGPLQAKEEVDAVRESWVEHIKSQDAVHDNRRAAVSVNLMLSMPEGTDRTQFKLAVRDFVEAEFVGRHETLMAFHDDTDKPHAHIAVLSRDDAGKSLDADRDLLDQWRDRFAARLRDRGIDADATPRHARGVYTKGLQKQDYPRDKVSGSLSRNRLRELSAAYVIEKEGLEPSQTPWRKAIHEKSDAIKVSYELAAAELSHSPDPGEREIGKRLEAFNRAMKPPRTRYDKMRMLVKERPDAVEAALRKHGPPGLLEKLQSELRSKAQSLERSVLSKTIEKKLPGRSERDDGPER